MDYIYKSCCNNFLRKVYDKNCRHKNLQYLINESINNIIKSINQNIQTTTGTHPSSWRYGGKIDWINNNLNLVKNCNKFNILFTGI